MTSLGSRWVLLLSLCGLGACAVRPVAQLGAMECGEQAMERGDLSAALAAFDAVDAGEPGYAIARLHAAAIEQRLFRQQELVLLGMRLRAECRDEEAVAVFEEALTAWPEDERTRRLAAGTRHRLQLRERVRDLAREWGAPGPASESGLPSMVPAMPGGETLAVVDHSDEPEGAGSPSPEAGSRAFGDDVVGARLAVVEERLQRGDLDASLRELEAMHAKWPGEVRLCGRYARLLLQRGLLHYGRGALDRAIADWRFAQTLDPTLASLAMLIDLAQREVAQPPR